MPGKGQIHDVFRDTLADLAERADAQAEAARGHGLRPWNRPDAAPDPLDIPRTTTIFDRRMIDANYQELLGSGEDPGTCGDVISIKTQSDVVAAAERGYRARHATPIRCLIHAMGRRKGHGHEQGVFLGGVLKHAQDALKAGQS
jgi:hypothetical protein